ncbi:hypothetical protein JX265_000873 [Neoarthrinium moseri]|uniref:Uncharacterized protein n=1 Tax=Neoarthrinium moseri TaxID=1658444 RepID=A0A9P9WWM3_9PEZI|nr:uncharacterized protein JN550_007021 [Neoarthrinium moseri]KAI1847634.1 hypothetical protein JX266_006486 [Neoarthrinium moseri]KAI1867290.1 hypothetical protein JN550_007021 [Neoarthrinium moseri]KAI1880633.1 hypothetical protein JX265_000873 [Neoarthrinium moseri]
MFQQHHHLASSSYSKLANWDPDMSVYADAPNQMSSLCKLSATAKPSSPGIDSKEQPWIKLSFGGSVQSVPISAAYLDNYKLNGKSVQWDEVNQYPLDDEMEQDMLRLNDEVSDLDEGCIPPSNVLHRLDVGSRSASEYGPNLQYRSPEAPPSEEAQVPPSGSNDVAARDDVLNYDIDWNAVLVTVKD